MKKIDSLTNTGSVEVPERVAAHSSSEKLARHENGLTGKPTVSTLPHKKL